MKLLDANILLYTYNSDSPHHEICRIWLEQAFNGAELHFATLADRTGFRAYRDEITRIEPTADERADLPHR